MCDKKTEEEQTPETVSYEGAGAIVTDRIRIYQGWLVRTVVNNGRGVSVHTVVVEDLNHRWDLKGCL